MIYYKDKDVSVYNSNCRDMKELADESIQCVVTSPPYWGLRKYKGNQDSIWGGKGDCQHIWLDSSLPQSGGVGDYEVGRVGDAAARTASHEKKESNICSLCGAWRGAYGLESTPELYVAHSIEILREIRRVLRKDGVVFWNIGDSYFANGTKRTGCNDEDTKGRFGGAKEQFNVSSPVLKPKDLCLIPFRVAISAQEDGWWVRSVIIWSKNNPMPESVKDRPTESHEYILLLTKSSRYYWDMEAVRENADVYGIRKGSSVPLGGVIGEGRNDRETFMQDKEYWGRNLRSVWTFPTQPYKEAHFATFPEELPERCIKAGTPEYGCCDKCGTPYERIVEDKAINRTRPNGFSAGELKSGACGEVETKTLGWQQSCKCENSNPVPSLVLDPFAGSGTTLWVAKKLGRKAVGYEISEEYCQLSLDRNRQQFLI